MDVQNDHLPSEADTGTMPEGLLKGSANTLLVWYNINKRPLPWRLHPSPYHTWLSEIMLQQTRVEAALPYYHRFLQALPTIAALAQADEGALLKLWEGLGYYSRVRNMQRAAKVVVEQYGAQLPSSAKELQKLPGIGAYTAGAIASIAFGERAAAVDGNVLRVLSRLTCSAADVAREDTKRQFARYIEAEMPKECPGDFNQALMELGALVCLPTSPKCGECPWKGRCRALECGRQEALPVKAAKPPRRVEQRVIVMAVNEGRLLVERRPPGLLGGLWQPLNFEGDLREEEIIERLEARGLRVKALRALVAAKHVFTHVEWHMRGYWADCGGAAEGTWASALQIGEQYAVASAFRVYITEYLQGVKGEKRDETAEQSEYRRGL